jgi:hypothetical protein
VAAAAERAGSDAEVQERLVLARHGRVLCAALAAEARERDDRVLEALGAVHGHDPHDVVGLLSDGGFDLDRLLFHRVAQMADERPEAPAAGGGEQAGVVDDREEVGRALLAVLAGQRELDQPGAIDDAPHDLRQ